MTAATATSALFVMAKAGVGSRPGGRSSNPAQGRSSPHQSGPIRRPVKRAVPYRKARWATTRRPFANQTPRRKEAERSGESPQPTTIVENPALQKSSAPLRRMRHSNRRKPAAAAAAARLMSSMVTTSMVIRAPRNGEVTRSDSIGG
ncbi:hypothetical protein CHKEEEPN_1374 [Methylorubrum podarium]|nr:hypothetical protein CHKEEEPN_1374 [Methylorubrum podarium]